MVLQRLPKRLQPIFVTRAIHVAHQDGDPFVPQRYQMLGRLIPAQIVIDRYHVDHQFGDVLRNQRHRQILLQQLPEDAMISRVRADDDTVDTFLSQQGQVHVFRIRVVVRVAHQQVKAQFPSPVLHPPRKLRKKRIGHIRNDEADRARTLSRQRGCDHAGLIAQLFNHVQDPFLRLRADPAGIVDHPGYRGDGHASLFCHVVNGRLHFSSTFLSDFGDSPFGKALALLSVFSLPGRFLFRN